MRVIQTAGKVAKKKFLSLHFKPPFATFRKKVQNFCRYDNYGTQGPKEEENFRFFFLNMKFKRKP